MKTTIQSNRAPDAETLTVFLERLGGRALRSDELKSLVGIVLRICDAAALAHRCGLVHCNLEPGNVTLDSRGQVHVMDAGVDEGLATPAYMAPEQAWGRRRDYDARTDVYAIGGILYAILTRTAPHSGGSASADLALAKCGTVMAPQHVCPERSLPPALCRIALRALSANPSERHPTVEMLKHDIEHFLVAQQPVQPVASAQSY